MMSMNSAYVDELYFEYLRDPDSVSTEWHSFFKTYKPEDATTLAGKNITTPAQVQAASSQTRMPAILEGDELIALSSIGGLIAENMQQSLSVPTATSTRVIPVKALEENRRILNSVLLRRRKKKLSFTHILAWAIVKSLDKFPNLNNTYGQRDGIHVKIKRGAVNLGLAVDTVRKDGSRILLVPSIKNANKLSFGEFVEAYDALIDKARRNKLTPDDLTGATVTLTNPGMIGTVMSVPRLMEGQGTIIATGSIDYPAEFQAMMPDVLSMLSVSKVVTVTSTYDHRVIQGAESGEFLQTMTQFLLGEHRFYDIIYAAFEIPYNPIRWTVEKGKNPFGPQNVHNEIDKEVRLIQMIHAYRVRGHLLANVNPLGLEAYHYPELDPAHYGFTIWDLDREFDTGGLGGVTRSTLRDIVDMLRDTYCGQIGLEFMHIQDPDKKEWVQKFAEKSHLKIETSIEGKIDTFKKLTRADLLENFLQTRFLGAKRFSLEGGESALVILDHVLELAADIKLQGVVLGMAHRGRLNVLVNMIGKPLEKLFKEFEGVFDPESFQGSGDVKYHLGARGTYVSRSKNQIAMFLAPNPSHLEAVNPVVEGIARAVQDEIGDASHSQVLPVLIHGDAAFAGQGVVMETLNLARLKGYSTGGTIHIVINNQIGFTTSPEDSRSTHYATGVAKMLQVPIIHVNGDDPDACRAAAEIAFAFREAFKDDVVVDMYCYRKYGHNEQDDPTATQPLLYKRIKQMRPVRKIYADRLVASKVLTTDAVNQIIDEEQAFLQNAFDNRGTGTHATKVTRLDYDMFKAYETKVSHANLTNFVEQLSYVPEGFSIHPKVHAEVTKRQAQFEEGTVQWGICEALAFSSLIAEGHVVRITGQDTGRGTFNHRQAVQNDIVNERRIIPIARMAKDRGAFHIYDSPLSEYAVLGFEYGYSTIAKAGLTIWEAQFGDFGNGAQIVIDQFITSAEEKWGQRSNITLLLPHGYDGQGPEHSSARLERFLQMCAQNNMIVCNFTSPANYFHAIRRQVKADWRKPMVIMSPKGYLRVFSSTVDELTSGEYREVINDTSIEDTSSVKRVVITTGKVHFELLRVRQELGLNDVALIRLEQIYPFNSLRMTNILSEYSNCKDVVWCQEEPHNMGAWFTVQPHLQAVLGKGQTLHYAGRDPAASPATGSGALHEIEQQKLLRTALTGTEG